jgi:predicted GIY-YIG superfamily endonuclease
MPTNSFYENEHANRPTVVYGLIRQGVWLYVGQTRTPNKRLREHQSGCKGCGTDDIPRDQRDFEMRFLEYCSYQMAHENEAKWIQKLNPTYNRRKTMTQDMRREHNKIRERERYGPLIQKNSEPMQCECGKKWDHTPANHNLDLHRGKSKMHLAFLKAQSAPPRASPAPPPTAPASPVQSQ